MTSTDTDPVASTTAGVLSTTSVRNTKPSSSSEVIDTSSFSFPAVGVLALSVFLKTSKYLPRILGKYDGLSKFVF